jgi:hypothetical protein
MNPLTFAARPLAVGLHQASRAIQFVADRLDQLAGDKSRREDGGPPSPQEAEIERARQRSTGDPKPLDDVSITRKVETELFRDADVPKGSIDVNTVEGVVWLRGEAKTPEMINELERRASGIPEVTRVENLLHLPKTPAPSRADTPRRQQKTRRSRRRPTERAAATRVTAEEEARADAEPSPKDVSQQGRGRPAAPLGSGESASDEDGGSSRSSS